MEQDNLSVDSLDPDQDIDVAVNDIVYATTEPQPWIIEQLVALITNESQIEQNEDGTPSLLAAQMKNELLDLIETHYFKTAMQNSFRDTFTYCSEALIKQIYDEAEQSEDELQ